MDEADDRAAPAAPGLRPRLAPVHSDLESQGAGVRPALRGGHHRLRREPFADGPAGRSATRPFRGSDAGLAACADGIFAYRLATVFPDAPALPLVLVRSAENGGEVRGANRAGT